MTNNMKILIDQVTTAINSEFGDDLPTLEQINEKADTFRVLFAQLYPISANGNHSHPDAFILIII